MSIPSLPAANKVNVGPTPPGPVTSQVQASEWNATINNISQAWNIKYFVSTGGNASDSYSGLSPNAPFATIGAALSALGTSPGHIVLMGGTYAAPATGIRTAGPQQSIEGIGAGLATIIDGSAVTTSGYAVVWLQWGRSAVRDLEVINVSGSVTAVRVTEPSNGAGGAYTSTENVHLSNILVGLTNGATAFGIGDNTAYDVSAIYLSNCCTNGDASSGSTHIQVGNGQTGNVLAINNIGGMSLGCDYGIVVSGGSITSIGMDYAETTNCIWFHKPAAGSTLIQGGRSENCTRAILNDFSNVAYSGAVVRDVLFLNMNNTDGKAILGTSGSGTSTMLLQNCVFTGANCPQYFCPRTNGGANDDTSLLWGVMEIENCTSEHPYPVSGTPWSAANLLMRVRNQRFIVDSGYDTSQRNGTGQHRAIRRFNITSASQTLTLRPDLYDVAQVGLAAAPGTITLLPGSFVGQMFELSFVQDGAGSHAWTNPSNIAWSGGSAPSNVTTARNKETTLLMWTGAYWEQRGPVMDIVPVSAATNAVAEDFSPPTGGPARAQYNLGRPYSSGVASGSNYWEHVPGGGDLGIPGSVCEVQCVGYIGDNQNPASGGLIHSGASAVIETGLKYSSMSTGISTTFNTGTAGLVNGAGVMAHYLDDQTFVSVIVANSGGNARFFVDVFSNGVHQFSNNYASGASALSNNTSHTLLAQCTSTGFSLTLDSQSPVTVNLSTSLTYVGDLTKHGILSYESTPTFSAFSVA